MLDSTRLRSNLTAAIDAFVRAAVALINQELQGRSGKAPASRVSTPRPKRTVAAPSSKLPTAAAAAQPAQDLPPASQPRPLANRANVFRVPAGSSLPPAPTTAVWKMSDSPIPTGIASEEIVARASQAIMTSREPLSSEQLRMKLKVSRDALHPVLERLVAEAKVRAVEVDGVVTYKPPRIEPIRRRNNAS